MRSRRCMAMSASRLSSLSMNSVADAVSALLDLPGEPWLPGLAPLLVESSRSWRGFDGGRSYGTARWVVGDPAGSREVAGKVVIAGHETLVEILPKGVAGRFGRLVLARTV